MKKVIFNLLATLLCLGALPMAQAQETEPQSLTAAQAHQLLRKISGSWLLSHYTWQPQSRTFNLSSGEADISHPAQGSYLHEQTSVRLPDGTKQRHECFIGYSTLKGRFELIQADAQSRNTTLMVGQWYPEFNAIAFKYPEGLLRGKARNMEYIYVFLPENALLKIVRTQDKKGNYLIQSKGYFALRHMAGK